MQRRGNGSQTITVTESDRNAPQALTQSRSQRLMRSGGRISGNINEALQQTNEDVDDLRKEMMELKSSLMQLKAENSRLSRRVDVTEAACVRVMTDDGSGAAMTIMEDDFQTLEISVKKRLRERSNRAGFHDLDREDVMRERWAGDTTFPDWEGGGSNVDFGNRHAPQRSRESQKIWNDISKYT